MIALTKGKYVALTATAMIALTPMKINLSVKVPSSNSKSAILMHSNLRSKPKRMMKKFWYTIKDATVKNLGVRRSIVSAITQV